MQHESYVARQDKFVAQQKLSSYLVFQLVARHHLNACYISTLNKRFMVYHTVSGQNPPGQNPPDKIPRTKSPRTKSPLGQNPPGQNPPGQNPPSIFCNFIDSIIF